MSMTQWVTLGFILIAAILSQTLLKSALSSIGGFDLGTLPQGLLKLVLNWRVVLAMICYVVGFVLYLSLLSRLEVSFIYPVQVSLGIVSVALVGWVFLNESMSLTRVLGTLLIISGVLLMNSR